MVLSSILEQASWKYYVAVGLNGGLAELRPPAELGEPHVSKPERRSRKNSLDLCGDGLQARVSFVRAGIGAPPPAIDGAPTPAIRAAP